MTNTESVGTLFEAPSKEAAKERIPQILMPCLATLRLR